LRQHTSDRDVIDVLERAAAERVALARQVKRLGELLAAAEATSWAHERTGEATAGWARFIEDERDPAALKAVAAAAIARGAPLVVVAAATPEPALVILRARDAAGPDLREHAAPLRELAQGKGGGGADLLTLIARDANSLRAAYDAALTRLGARA
jgi:hypothetical protein